MEIRSVLIFVVGVLVGGIAVYTIVQDKSSDQAPASQAEHSMTMDEMVSVLQGKSGNEFDQAFIAGMIEHHVGAVEMAEAATQSALHEEIKDMAQDIIEVQNQEIEMMKAWQIEWGYTSPHTEHE